MNSPFYLGVDLGGTQLRMAIVDARGRLISEVSSVSTGRAFGPNDLVRELGRLWLDMQRSSDGLVIEALGIGTPGVIVDQTITESDNLPLLNRENLQRLATSVFACPITVENDARCFALAEARYGAGNGAKTICGLTLGTGVGCGVIINREIYRGSHSAAGEVYRIPLRGFHLEHFLSGAGLVRSFLEAGGDISRAGASADGALVGELARQGDAAALAAWARFADDLLLVCECIISLIDPDVIVIGGSISQARDLFGSELTKRLEGRPTRVSYAQLGTKAGVIGAAALNIPL